MKTLSIDVGIKHLAYCMFGDHYTITKWGICNLTGFEVITCNVCGKKAKYQRKEEMYCKIHVKNKQYKIPRFKIQQIKKMKLVDLKENFDLKEKIRKRDALDCILTDLSNNYYEFIEYKNCKDFDMVEIGKNMKKQFDDLFGDIDCVLIENQIGPLANRMKTLQGMIMQYFISRGVLDIKQISSSNKLSLFIDKKTTYNERKKLSIEITKQLIYSNNMYVPWVEYFNKNKKKDDLADSFLQGISYFVEKQNLSLKNYRLRLT